GSRSLSSSKQVRSFRFQAFCCTARVFIMPDKLRVFTARQDVSSSAGQADAGSQTLRRRRFRLSTMEVDSPDDDETIRHVTRDLNSRENCYRSDATKNFSI
ncbi:hypothetical protein TNCV_2536001, partial [Trichonephila clavipes]